MPTNDIYAMIENNVIINLIIWDGVAPYTPPPGASLELLSALPAGCQIGSTLSNGVWLPPDPSA